MFGRKSKNSGEKGRGAAYPAQGGAHPAEGDPQPGGYSSAGSDDGLPGSAGYRGGKGKHDHPNLRFRFAPPKREL